MPVWLLCVLECFFLGLFFLGLLEASLSFLDVLDYFINLFLFREVLSYYVFKYFLRSFLSLFSLSVHFSSVQLSCVWLLVTPWIAACQASMSITNSWVYSNSCPLSQWCHSTISSSVIPFCSCLQSFPAPGSLLVSQFFTSGGQSIGVSASASVLPMNIQDDFL